MLGAPAETPARQVTEKPDGVRRAQDHGNLYPPWGDEHLMSRGAKGTFGRFSDVDREMVGPVAGCVSTAGRAPASRSAGFLTAEAVAGMVTRTPVRRTRPI
jgi:hypothetical protein